MKDKIKTVVQALTTATTFYYGSKYEFNVAADAVVYPCALLLPLRGSINFVSNSLFKTYNVVMMFITSSQMDADYETTKVNIDAMMTIAKAFLNDLLAAYHLTLTTAEFEEFDQQFNQNTAGVILSFTVTDETGESIC